MLRIRKISDSHTPANRSAIEEAQAIIRAQFPGMSTDDIDKLPDQLDNPFRQRLDVPAGKTGLHTNLHL